MTTETFDNRIHNALFFEGNSVTNGQNYSEKWSDLILSALKDVGVFDNMVIQDTRPTEIDGLWLDTRPHPTLPSVLRIFNEPTQEWRQITFSDLFDQIGGGGSNIVPTNYESTSAVRTAIQNGTLTDGARFRLYDEPMIVDRSLDNDPASWLYNTNGDANLGVRTLSNLPFNYSVFPGFKTQDNNRLFLHTSPDNVRFYRLNKYPIIRGGGDSFIGGRDSQLFWNENLGEWWMPVTSGTAVTEWDFSVFRSKDLITWGLSRGFLDANSAEGLIRGRQLPGTEQPVERQWSNKFYRFNGTLYIVTSLQVLNDRTNAFGNPGPAFRPYIAEVIDEDAMTFGPPQPLQIGASTDPKLNPDIILVDGVYYACIKNSPDRTIEVWSTSNLFGSWTLRTTIDIDPNDFDSLEGNTWAVHKYVDPNDDQNILIKYRLHLANNRDENDELIGIPRFTESLTSPAGPYGPIEQLDFSYASRNGTITNTAMVNDPRAMRTLMAAEAAFGGEKRDDIDEAEQLRSGTHNLYPQQDFEYYILGEGGSTTVEIQEHVADRFFLAVHNTNPDATITVNSNSITRPFTVGGGNQELIEVRWSEQINRYIPVGRFGTGGGGGSTTLAPPRNLFLASFFTTQDDRTIHLHVSLDGQNWSVINVEGLAVTDTIPFDQGGCAITYFDDQFWIFGTGNNPGVHDFVLYRSPDLTRWSKHQVAFQGGPILSDTEPYAGGTVPADRLWAPEILIDDDGRVYMYMTIRYQEGETRIYGDQINGYRVFVSEFIDFENLTFTAPTLVDTGDTNSQIDLHVIKHDGVYYASLKNEAQRRIRIYSGTSPTGPFTYTGREFFDNNRSQEAPSIVPVYYTAGISDDTEVVRWRLYVDNNRTNPGSPFAGIGQPDANQVIGQQLYYESEGDTPASAWGPAMKPSFDLPVRHGTVINLRNFPPEAAQKVAIASAASKSPRKALTREIELSPGDNYIHPREGEIYFVNGNTVANVYILEGGADSFFLAKYAANDTAGINVIDTDFVPSAYTFGFAQNADTWVEFRRRGERDLYVMGNQTTVTGGTGGSGITVQNEGTPLATAATTLNFTGAGVTATGTGATKTINIPGGSAGAANDFRTRAAANAALASASNGTMFTVNGIEAVVDSTATGNESVFHDISGGIGARLIGDVIDTRFFEVGTEQNSDDTANLIAANTYALAAHTAANGGIKFVVSGYVPVTSPLVIGQTLEGFEIDMGGARFEVLTGWTGGTSGYVLDLRGRTATKKLPFVNCNKRCNGIRFGNNAGSTIIGGAVYRMTEIGFRVSGSNCTFINQFGYEYDNGDPEFNTDANFVADVIRVVGNDLKMISPNVGWAARPIYLAAGAAEVELIAPHPFNGNPNADGSTILQRAHPRCIVSDAGGRVYISDLYLDNGYIEDRTANLRVLSGRSLLLTNRVTITEPMFRVNADNDVNTVVDNYQGQFGFYTGAWQDDASNLVTDIHESAFSGPSVGLQRVTKVRGRDTTILREAGVDFNYAKRGDGTATITQRYRPGTGGSVDLQYSNGVLKVSSGLDGDAAVNPGSIQLYEDNPTGTTGSSILMKNTGDTGTTTITTSASGLLVDGSPISGGGGGVTVQDEGSALATTATTLNFTGSGVTASGTGATKAINIPGDPGFITEDAATGAKFIVSGSADNEAGILNLYPEGTDGVGIGVSSLGLSTSGGAGLAAVTAFLGGGLRVVVDDNTNNMTTSRDAGQTGTVYSIGTETEINSNNGSIQFVSLTAARTLDIADFLNGDKVIVDVRNADTNALTITSSSGTIRWVGGSAPSSFDVRTLLGIARRGSDIFIGAVGF